MINLYPKEQEGQPPAEKPDEDQTAENPGDKGKEEDKEKDKGEKGDDWEIVKENKEPARGNKYKGGQSIEQTQINKGSGQVWTRHTIIKNGNIVHDHYRY